VTVRLLAAGLCLLGAGIAGVAVLELVVRRIAELIGGG
jgi:hypothetical protein